MKVQTTKARIKAQKSFVLGLGYCTIPHLLKKISVEPTLYNAGVYGWCCDFYPINADLGIVTGYNVDRAYDLAQWDLNSEFNDKLNALENNAKAIQWSDKEESLKNDFIDLLYKAKNGEFTKSYKGYIDGKLWAKGNTKGELKADFYASRSTLKEFYKLDRLPTYSELTIKFDWLNFKRLELKVKNNSWQ